MRSTLVLQLPSPLKVTFTKLKKYVKQQGGYDLDVGGGQVTLSFVPTFPEALEKSWAGSQTPRVIMHGSLRKGIVTFHLIQVEENNAVIDKDPEVAELTYRDWLQYIEDSY